jgi:hypothetical protein
MQRRTWQVDIAKLVEDIYLYLFINNLFNYDARTSECAASDFKIRSEQPITMHMQVDIPKVI